MAPQGYGVVLRERLGNHGYEALEEMMEDNQKELLTVDRFERRLVEESAALQQQIGGLRLDMSAGDAGLRLEIGAVRHDVATVKFDLVRWMFVFWVGQTFAVAGILGAMLRFMRP